MRNFAICFVVGMLASAAFAAPAKVKITDNIGNGNGGSFSYARVSGGLLPGAQSGVTFCLELDENVSFGNEYYTQIATSADNGGAGGPDPDPLDPKTAAVYRKYLTLGSPTVTDANTYQLAIWFLEEEIVYDAVQSRWERSDNGNNVHNNYNGISKATVDALIASVGNPSSILNARVMRLWNNYNANNGTYSGARQDMIIVIPAPAAALLGLIGLGTAAWAKRRSA